MFCFIASSTPPCLLFVVYFLSDRYIWYSVRPISLLALSCVSQVSVRAKISLFERSAAFDSVFLCFFFDIRLLTLKQLMWRLWLTISQLSADLASWIFSVGAWSLISVSFTSSLRLRMRMLSFFSPYWSVLFFSLVRFLFLFLVWWGRRRFRPLIWNLSVGVRDQGCASHPSLLIPSLGQFSVSGD